MKLKHILSLVAAIGFLTLISCGSNNQETNENVESLQLEDKEIPTEERAQKVMHDEVMATHDEAMELLETIMRLKGVLHEQVDLRREKGENDKINDLENSIKKLELADEAMMNWMHEFDSQFGSDKSNDAIMAYYEKEMKKIEHVHEQMKKSIREAESLTMK